MVELLTSQAALVHNPLVPVSFRRDRDPATLANARIPGDYFRESGDQDIPGCEPEATALCIACASKNENIRIVECLLEAQVGGLFVLWCT